MFHLTACLFTIYIFYFTTSWIIWTWRCNLKRSWFMRYGRSIPRWFRLGINRASFAYFIFNNLRDFVLQQVKFIQLNLILVLSWLLLCSLQTLFLNKGLLLTVIICAFCDFFFIFFCVNPTLFPPVLTFAFRITTNYLNFWCIACYVNFIPTKIRLSFIHGIFLQFQQFTKQVRFLLVLYCFNLIIFVKNLTKKFRINCLFLPSNGILIIKVIFTILLRYFFVINFWSNTRRFHWLTRWNYFCLLHHLKLTWL